jgi:two-component system response regulator CpxR
MVAVNRILVVDDDVSLCSLMADFFSEHDMQVEFAHDGRSGLASILSKSYDLVILDDMLPALDGFQVLDQLRRRSAVPVIMLTARVEEQDRVAGLNRGADDYLLKPFGPDELLARIHAVLRRVGKGQGRSAALRCGEITLDPMNREVRRTGDAVKLTSVEFEILQYLMKAGGRIVSRDEITTVLYQRQSTPYERSLDVHISHLRKKLESVDRPVIHTVRGIGYLLAGTVETE